MFAWPNRLTISLTGINSSSENEIQRNWLIKHNVLLKLKKGLNFEKKNQPNKPGGLKVLQKGNENSQLDFKGIFSASAPVFSLQTLPAWLLPHQVTCQQ